MVFTSTNRLLAGLPATDYDRIRPRLRDLSLTPGQVLQAQDELISQVVFPNGGGACSLTKQLWDGGTTEVAIVGSEGVVGASVFFGDDVSSYGVSVEAPSATAQTMSPEDFIEEMSRGGALYTLVTRYNLQSRSMLIDPRCASMNANASPFARNRTGWLFLGVHAPLAGVGARAPAPATFESRSRVESSEQATPPRVSWVAGVPP